MKRSLIMTFAICLTLSLSALVGCAQQEPVSDASADKEPSGFATVEDSAYEPESSNLGETSGSVAAKPAERKLPDIQLTEDYRENFVHGEKGPEYQKYIVLHDTEGESDPQSVIDFWDGSGNLIAAHFVVGMDGSICQCVPLDKIAHHAGYGDTGHNDEFGIEEDGRDDMEGSTPIGEWASDYGMNAWSVGIEMVHVGGSGYYPEEQLEAVDDLIAYIDAYYGFESEIIDHKAWRSGNSDTSPEFADYLENYQDHRMHA